MTDRAPAEVLALRDHPNSEDSVELDRRLEERVLACLLLDPKLIEQIDSAEPALVSPQGKAIANACEAVFRRTGSLELMSLADQLEAQGKLQTVGGVEALARLSDAETSVVHFEDYIKTARERKRRQVIHGLGRELSSLTDTERAEELASELLEVARSSQYEAIRPSSIGFSGQRVRDLLERKRSGSPLPGLMDTEPSLHVLLGRPKSAKTRFAMTLASAWCQGVAPWNGGPDLPGTRSLFLSGEQSATRLGQMAQALQVGLPGGSIDNLSCRMNIVARDSELDPFSRTLLVLDSRGRSALRSVLDSARDAGDPFGLVVVDSLSRIKPSDLDENSSDDMTKFLDPLATLATETSTYIVVIHHAGHSEERHRKEARSAGRGGSAIEAVPQVAMLIERHEKPNLRRLKVDGNDLPTDEMIFEVSPAATTPPGLVYYFKPVDELLDHPVDRYLAEGEQISTNELAWRISGKGAPSGSTA